METRRLRYKLRFIFVSAVVSIMVILLPATLAPNSSAENSDDALITSAIKTKLATDKVPSLSRIAADTNERVVYLRGTVENALIKARATEVAGQVRGVRAIVNHLEVQHH